MSLYGYNRETTPFLSKFAEEVTVYTQTRSPGMTSLPSHTSMFTGLSVEEHGAHDSVLHKIKPGHTIWDTLRKKYNFTTGVFSYNPNLVDSDSSLRSAFDYVESGNFGIFPNAKDVDDFLETTDDEVSDLSRYLNFFKWAVRQETPTKTLTNGISVKINSVINSPRLERVLDRSAEQYIESFLNWSENQSEPWAACVNLLDAHNPYYPQQEFDLWGGSDLQRFQSSLSPNPWKVYGGQISWSDWNSLEDLYDGTIRQLDSWVEYLIKNLRDRGDYDDTLIVVTSDHGEGFGEVSRVRPKIRIAGHVTGLHECLLHVPLLVSYPNQTSGMTNEKLASLTQFPHAVQSALNGSWSGDEFIPDGKVIASGTNIREKLSNVERVAKYCDNSDRFAGVIRAVYEKDGEDVLKHISWGSDTATVRIESPQQANKVEGYNTAERISSAFNPLENAEILIHNTSVDSATQRRLADLGYV